MDDTIIRALFRRAINTESPDDVATLRSALIKAGGDADLIDYAIGEPVPDWRDLGVKVSGWVDGDGVQGATLHVVDPL